MLSLESGDRNTSSSSSSDDGGEGDAIRLEGDNSSSSAQPQEQQNPLPSSPPSSLPSLMSLVVPPPPIANASTANLPISVPCGSGSPSQQLHILVISQPQQTPVLSDSLLGRRNSFQSVKIFPGTRKVIGLTRPPSQTKTLTHARAHPIHPPSQRKTEARQPINNIVGKGLGRLWIIILTLG